MTPRVFAVAVLYEGYVADTQNDIFRPGAARWDVDTPIYYDGKCDQLEACLGYANLDRATHMDGATTIFARITLTPLAQAAYGPVIGSLTPAACGSILKRDGSNDITECAIRHIGLFTSPNADRRIRTVAEQLDGTDAQVICRCHIRDLMTYGHQPRCPEKRK